MTRKTIRLIGDIHGDFEAYKELTRGSEFSVQVGDFGIGFAGPYWHDRTNKFHSDGNHKFIRGNHDNPEKCKEMIGWISDGTIDENGIFYIGGAASIDRSIRTQDVDWWPEEELSIVELNKMIDLYEASTPDIVISHTFPYGILREMFVGESKILLKSRTELALQTMFEIHQPSHWIGGHWHMSRVANIMGTEFRCLNIEEVYDLEL